MGEPESPSFYDFRIFGRVPGSQNQYHLSLETPGYQKQIKGNPCNIFQHSIFGKFNVSEMHF